MHRTSVAGGYLKIQNIDGIDVLKGPQGTLFGRNATGGVIAAHTKDPGTALHAYGTAEVGDYGLYAFGLGVSGPLSDKVTASVDGYRSKLPGYGHNLVTGHGAFGDDDRLIDGKVKVDLGRTVIRIGADWSKETTGDGGAIIPPGAISSVTHTTAFQGYYNTTTGIDDYVTSTQYGGSIRVNHELGWADLRSISAFRSTATAALQTSVRSPPYNQSQLTTTGDKAWTQEFELASVKSSPIIWIVGTFVLIDHAFVSLVNGISTNVANGPSSSTYTSNVQNTQAYALFGQVTVPLGHASHLTGGFWYSIDDIGARNSVLSVPVTGYMGAPSGAAPTATQGAASQTFKSPTWRLALDHNFGSNLFAYASYNRGFKSGLFNLMPFNANAVQPEKLDAYEIGLKSEFFDHRMRLNGAAYCYDYRNMQVSASVVVPGASNVTLVTNAGTATIKGADVLIDVAVTRRLKLRGALAYIDGHYTRFPGATSFILLPSGGTQNVVIDASGLAIFKVSPYNVVVTASYTLPTTIGEIKLAANSSYKSGYYWSAALSTRRAPTDTINLGLDWPHPSERFKLGLYVQNLTDAMVWGGLGSGPTSLTFTPGKPRTFGAVLTAKY